MAVAVVSGKVYAIGGQNSAKNEVFDPGTGSWTVKSDMPTARGWPAIAVVANRIYVIGGRASNGANLRTIDVYDPATDAWTSRTSPAGVQWPAKEGAVAAVVSGRIYLMGGRTGNSYLNTVDECDPTTDSWIPMNTMSDARAYFGGGVIGSELYVAGGTEFNGSFPNTLASAEKATISTSLVGAQSSSPVVAVDESNTVHVAWGDGIVWQPDPNSIVGFSVTGSNNIYYRTKESGQPLSTAVQLTTSGASVSPDLAVGVNNALHLAYIDYPSGNGAAMYMEKNGGGWSVPIIAAPQATDLLRIASDASHQVHLVWRYWNDAINQSTMQYRSGSADSWTSVENITTNGTPQRPTISVDSLGRPHVTCEDWQWPEKLLYTYKRQNWVSPIKLNHDSQVVANSSSDASLARTNDEMHAVWLSWFNGNSEVFYNYAVVGSTNDISPPSVSVIAPHAGEVLSVGSSTTILWEALDDQGVASVDIHLTTDGGISWSVIATSELNDGQFSWIVSDTGTSIAQIKVSARDLMGNVNYSTSGPFTTADLTPPSVSLISPTGGVTLSGNANANLTWSGSDNVGITRIDLEYSLDGGQSWLVLASGLSNLGSYTWSVPNTPTTTLLIRATAGDAAGLAASATSGLLTIVKGNTSPITPHSPFPLNGATNIPLTLANLAWSGGDVDGDVLEQQLSFGANSNLPLVYAGTATLLHIGLLRPETTYTWQVTVSDGITTTIGPVWYFTTESGSFSHLALREIQCFDDGVWIEFTGLLFGEVYQLQISPDLTNWTTEATLNAIQSTITFQDSSATNLQRRFYRLIAP
ncbi:MAG: hypothetical protein KIS67_16325 [Verrucomicrobiae bacterium]|nr:hypothetical protein [Verrucomicrobiae bacterium]